MPLPMSSTNACNWHIPYRTIVHAHMCYVHMLFRAELFFPPALDAAQCFRFSFPYIDRVRMRMLSSSLLRIAYVRYRFFVVPSAVAPATSCYCFVPLIYLYLRFESESDCELCAFRYRSSQSLRF